MRRDAATVEEYLASLPSERFMGLAELRKSYMSLSRFS